MQSKEKDNLIFVRLFPGEKVMDSLKMTCQKCKVKTAVVLSGLGQLGEFELGFFKEKGDYLPERFTEPHELLSLTGNISVVPILSRSRQNEDKKEYNFHLHAVLGNAQKQVKGGHFISGIVSVTAEIVLLKTDIGLIRKTEPETGLKGLFLK